jgi:hypothetical protein
MLFSSALSPLTRGWSLKTGPPTGIFLMSDNNAITLGPMAAHVALPWIHRLFSGSGRLPRTAQKRKSVIFLVGKRSDPLHVY